MNEALKILRFVLTRVVFLYLIFYLHSKTIVNYNLILTKSINQRRPSSFEYLIKLANTQDPIDHRKLKEYVYYFEKIKDSMPSRDEAWGILGYCHFYQGNIDQSIEAYQRAAKLRPDFFWYFYNLGLIYFKNGDYKQSAFYFEKALETDFEKNTDYMIKSRVYLPILTDYLPSFSQLKVFLKEGYRDSHLLLILCYEKLENYKKMITEAGRALVSDIDRQDIFFFYAAVAALKNGENSRANYLFKKSLHLNPTIPQTYMYLSSSVGKMGHTKLSQEFDNQAKILLKEKNPSPVVDETSFRLRLY